MNSGDVSVIGTVEVNLRDKRTFLVCSAVGVGIPLCVSMLFVLNEAGITALFPYVYAIVGGFGGGVVWGFIMWHFVFPRIFKDWPHK